MIPLLFVDANVFFAAAYSTTGGSYFLLELAKQKRFRIITVAHVLQEAEANIQNKIGIQALQRHYENLLLIEPKLQPLESLPLEFEKQLHQYIPQKDIPILAGAIMSGARVIVTLDKKHFLDNQQFVVDSDGWTIRTADGSISAHYEHTVVITHGHPILLTAA